MYIYSIVKITILLYNHMEVIVMRFITYIILTLFNKLNLQDVLLFAVISNKLQLTIDGNVKVKDLNVAEYTLDAFVRCDLSLVSDIVIAYCLNEETPGIGDKSWEDFFNAVEKYEEGISSNRLL